MASLLISLPATCCETCQHWTGKREVGNGDGGSNVRTAYTHVRGGGQDRRYGRSRRAWAINISRGAAVGLL